MAEGVDQVDTTTARARTSETARRATYQDVIDAPPHMVAEIVDGELFLSPRPAFPHAVASSQIGADLLSRFGRGSGGGGPGPEGWWIIDEPELRFGEDTLVPDLAGWRRERMPVPADVPFVRLAPDWVCEVLSPSTAGLDRVRKMRVYAREGVPHLWLVDPLGRTLEVYRRQEGHWLVAATFAWDTEVRAEPFEAESFDMKEWWLPAPPAPGEQAPLEPEP